jgi:4'-phosphopantetheinyl transferase
MERRDTLPDSREVHVWFVELAAGAASVEACLRSLSANERERASRFRFEHLKTAFTLSRGILRVLLGRYLAFEPDRVRFAYGPRGKPRLAFPESPLEFNLAHSGRFAAYAFTVGCELGVDIEEVRPGRDQESIVRRFFSREECEEWLGLDLSQRDEAFFRCWTRKESYIKALGDGLSMPLDSFQVSLRPGSPAALVHAAEDPTAASKWSLCSLAPAQGYIGSLAVPELARNVRILPRLTADAVLELVSGPGPFPPAAKEVIRSPETRFA